MARLTEKPGDFRAGDPKVSASKLNALIAGTIREVVGGQGVDVSQYGDRYHLKNVGEEARLADVSNYLARATVQQEFDDYLLCAHYEQPDDGKNWKPYVYDPTFGQSSTSTFYVAKPLELQRTPWDGKTVDGVRYTYTEVGDRLAGAAEQTISRPYAAGDVLYCVRGATGLSDPNDVPIGWIDLNTAARRWEGTADASVTTPTCKLAASLQTTDCLLATASNGNSVNLTYDGVSKYVSDVALTYSGGSGVVKFWYDGAGRVHLSVAVPAGSGVMTDKELIDCGDGCFRGGPLTGHLPATGAGACAGHTFSVCLKCEKCAFVPGWYCVEDNFPLLGSGVGSVCPGQTVGYPSQVYLTFLPASCNMTYNVTGPVGEVHGLVLNWSDSVGGYPLNYQAPTPSNYSNPNVPSNFYNPANSYALSMVGKFACGRFVDGNGGYPLLFTGGVSYCGSVTPGGSSSSDGAFNVVDNGPSGSHWTLISYSYTPGTSLRAEFRLGISQNSTLILSWPGVP